MGFLFHVSALFLFPRLISLLNRLFRLVLCRWSGRRVARNQRYSGRSRSRGRCASHSGRGGWGGAPGTARDDVAHLGVGAFEVGRAGPRFPSLNGFRLHSTKVRRFLPPAGRPRRGHGRPRVPDPSRSAASGAPSLAAPLRPAARPPRIRLRLGCVGCPVASSISLPASTASERSGVRPGRSGEGRCTRGSRGGGGGSCCRAGRWPARLPEISLDVRRKSRSWTGRGRRGGSCGARGGGRGADDAPPAVSDFVRFELSPYSAMNSP